MTFLPKDEIATAVKTELQKAMESFGYSILNSLVTDVTPAAQVRDAMNNINAAQRLRLAAVEKAEAEKVSVVKAAEAEAEAKYLQARIRVSAGSSRIAVTPVLIVSRAPTHLFLQGTGIARQRQAIINGLRESVSTFNERMSTPFFGLFVFSFPGLDYGDEVSAPLHLMNIAGFPLFSFFCTEDVSSKQVMDMMVTTQYFDMLRDVGIHSRSSTIFIPHSPGAVSDIAAQVRSGLMQASYAAPGAQVMQAGHGQ